MVSSEATLADLTSGSLVILRKITVELNMTARAFDEAIECLSGSPFKFIFCSFFFYIFECPCFIVIDDASFLRMYSEKCGKISLTLVRYRIKNWFDTTFLPYAYHIKKTL
ncbi:hypothetical protein BpHYR1_052257 [Brachionus plicatilis]|uniref:Uncharacterized protein n=1 Tax=Brachionus plicatilis TaxID=10195 RepID=A0A3M7TAP8_BRAPC|nr:hypothetical protein BpHYR1_052257 [Brachionus plicatilis]